MNYLDNPVMVCTGIGEYVIMEEKLVHTVHLKEIVDVQLLGIH